MNIQTLAMALPSRDPRRYSRWFAEGIRLYTPMHEEPITGRDAACQILSFVFSLFDDFHYPDVLSGKEAHALFFRTRVGGVPLEGVDYIRTDAEGRVTKCFVLLRPLDAITTLSKAIGARMREGGGDASPDTSK